MDYPLNLTNKALGGFAKADDEAQHKALSDLGYEPKWEAPADAAAEDDAAMAAAEEVVHTVETLRAQLDAKGIAYDNRWGVKRLQQALEA